MHQKVKRNSNGVPFFSRCAFWSALALRMKEHCERSDANRLTLPKSNVKSLAGFPSEAPSPVMAKETFHFILALVRKTLVSVAF